VKELALFGSALGSGFGPDSDVDVLVTLAAGARWTFDEYLDAEEELGAIFGRKVDLVGRHAIEASRNYIRREAILGSAQVIHVA
jgi:hypothetical protein